MLPYFTWIRSHGWTHFDHFTYCERDHKTHTGKGKRRTRSNNYIRTEPSGAVVVAAVLNVQTHVIACSDCVWDMYQKETNGKLTRELAEFDNETGTVSAYSERGYTREPGSDDGDD